MAYNGRGSILLHLNGKCIAIFSLTPCNLEWCKNFIAENMEFYFVNT